MAGLSAHVPIADLSPELDAQSSKSVKAIVTLTWPYSSATGSVAFLLAEPDFRLRRSKGQVRVQFSGSSAKRIAKSGIASGDEVVISLDGVEWLREATAPSTPGSGVDFELKFTERLLLQFKQEGSETEELIDIDHPPQEPERDVIPNRETTPEPTTSLESNKLRKPHDTVLKNGDEWSSPAFIKRARTSYGSLFDTGYDPFAEEDGTIPGKGRKKSRLSSTWRYVSRSPSPEPDNETIPDTSPTAATAVAPVMADEGSQTVPLGDADAAETLAHFSREAGSLLRNAEAPITGEGHELFGSHLPQIRTTEMQPPATHLHFGLDTADATQQADSSHATPTQAPSSPRLKPIPSDALPLVSPLVTSQSSPFRVNGERTPAIDDQALQPFNPESLKTNTSIGKLVDHAADHYDEQHMPPSTFQEHSMHAAELHDTTFESDPHGNDTFNHWQSPDTEVGLLGPDHSTYQTQRTFYVGEIEESGVVARHFGDNIAGHGPIDQPNIPPYPGYESLDAELHSQGVNNLWAPGPPVTYPELPEHQDEIGHTESHRLSPSSDKLPVVKDTTSGVVDLTESDEDEDEQVNSERSFDDRAGEGSIEASESEEEEVEEEHDEMEEEPDAVSEGYSEQNEGYRRYGHEENFSEEDGEAEEYDEDEMEEDEPVHRPSAPKGPVVIDLLSSDDEDNLKTAVPAPRPVTSRQQMWLEEANESKEEEEDEQGEKMSDSQALDTERDISYSQRSELPTSIPHHASPENEDTPATVEKNDRHADKDEPVDEEFEDAREERDTIPIRKEHIPHAPAMDTAEDMPAAVSQPAEIAAIPTLGEATNRSPKDTELSAEKPAASRRRLPETASYNLDGADDLRSPPKKTTHRKQTRDLRSRSMSHDMVIEQTQPPFKDSVQLPTPDPTQLSVVKDIQEESTAASDLPMIDDSQASSTVQTIGVTQDEKGDTTIVENNIVPVGAAHVEQGEVKPAEVKLDVEDTFTNSHDLQADQDRTAENETSTRRTSARLSHDNHKPETQPDNHDENSQNMNPPSPRRSRRLRHASGSAAQIAEIMRPSTPDQTREEGNVDEKSPGTPNSLARQGEQDPSIEMAMSALKSSPKAHHDLRSTSVVDLKLSLSRALRTDLSEFTALKVLRFHIGQKLDVFGIVTSTQEEPRRTKGGPRHYQTTFNITDSSIAPSGVTEIQVHRPHIEALPIVVPGDGILLRNFQVIAIKNRGFALRSDPNEACSWAVFKDGVAEPEIRGPPVEYGEAEKKHMAAMKEWYSTLDSTAAAKLQRANADKGGGVGGGKGVGKVL